MSDAELKKLQKLKVPTKISLAGSRKALRLVLTAFMNTQRERDSPSLRRLKSEMATILQILNQSGNLNPELFKGVGRQKKQDLQEFAKYMGLTTSTEKMTKFDIVQQVTENVGGGVEGFQLGTKQLTQRERSKLIDAGSRFLDLAEKTIEVQDENRFDFLRLDAVLDILRSGRIPTLRDVEGKSIFESFQQAVIPGYNYCGSGTNVIKNFLEGVRPKNRADEACMIHDIRYLEIGASNAPDAERAQAVRDADNELIDNLNSIDDPTQDERQGRLVGKSAMRSKIAAETTGVINPLGFIGDSVPLGAQVEKDLVNLVREETGVLGAIIQEEAPRDAALVEALLDDIDAVQEKLIRTEEAVFDEPREPKIKEFNVVKEELGSMSFDEPEKEKKPVESIEGTEMSKPLAKIIRDLKIDIFEEDNPTVKAQMREVLKVLEGQRSAGAAAEGVEGQAGEEEKVSEEQAVLEEGVLRSLEKIPEISVERSQELVEAQKQANPADAPIIGERSMRPLLVRAEGDQVELNQQQIQENRLWLENFTWVDPGFGNGNQERLPWNFTGGKANNTLYQAQEKNMRLRFSGSLNDGDQQYRHKKQMSAKTKEAIKTLHIPNIQNEQKFIRNGSLPAGLGRPIHMLRKAPEGTSWQNVNMKSRRLVNPDIVKGKRYIRRV